MKTAKIIVSATVLACTLAVELERGMMNLDKIELIEEEEQIEESKTFVDIGPGKAQDDHLLTSNGFDLLLGKANDYTPGFAKDKHGNLLGRAIVYCKQQPTSNFC